MRGWLRDIILSVSCCRACKGQRQCQVVEKLTPHMLREGEESWTVCVQRTANLSPLGCFLGEVRTGHIYAVHRVDGCACTRFVYFSTNIADVGRSEVKATTRTTNSTGRLDNDHHRAACTPHSTLYSSQESCSLSIFQRLPSDAVYLPRCG